jgi:hypothetical protein
MVAVIGIVVCVYVLAQCIRAAQLDGTTGVVKAVLYGAAVVSCGAGVFLAVSFADLKAASVPRATLSEGYTPPPVLDPAPSPPPRSPSSGWGH